MTFLTGMVLSLIFMLAQSKDSNNVLVVIGDILEYQAAVAPQGVVTIHLCSDGAGSQVSALQLMKYMSRRNVMVSTTFSFLNFLEHMDNTEDLEAASTYVWDLSCANSTDLLQEVSRRRMFTLRNRWILLENGITPDLGDLNIFIDSDVYIISKTTEDQFLLEEVYRLGDKLLRKTIGVWEKDKGVTPTASLVVSLRRMNFQRTVIKAVIAVLNNDSLNHLEDTKDKHIDTITKLGYRLFMHVLEILNASVELVVVNSWGYSTNGTWNGMTGYLQRGEADIGATQMFFLKDRFPVLWYIHSSSPSKGSFVFRQPPLSVVKSIFTLPFTRSVWLASTGLVTFIGILIYFAFRWEARQDVNTKDASWSDVMLMCLGAVCQQGSTTMPKTISGRLLTILLFVATIFLYTSYSACIVALLQSKSNSIQTLSDLLHSSLSLGVYDTSYYRHYFGKVNDPIRSAIYTRKICPPGAPENFMTQQEGMERVRKGLFAFYYELSAAYKLMSDTFLEEEKCGLQFITFFPENIATHITVSKKSPYKEVITLAYRRLQDVGLQHRENRRLYEKKPECTGHGSSFVSVGFLDCYAALLILVYGFLCAFLLLFIEILTYRRILKLSWRKKTSQFTKRRISQNSYWQ